MRHFLKFPIFLFALALSISCNKDSDDTTTATYKTSAEIARSFYQDVIVNKDMTKFNTYIGDTYLQHATGYADGVAPLRTELEENAKSGNQIKILRVVGENNYAALHSLWTINGKKILYVDIWRVENGKLVEHWDQYQEVATTSLNTNTMYSGPDADVNAKQNLEKNKEKAVLLLNVFDNLEDLSPVENFVSPNYIQHNPTVSDGKKAFLAMLTFLKESNYKSKTTISKTIAMGDMVVVHSKVIDLSVKNDKGTGAIDIFRFDTLGQIVEHWDVLEALTGESLNKNDPFFYPN